MGHGSSETSSDMFAFVALRETSLLSLSSSVLATMGLPSSGISDTVGNSWERGREFQDVVGAKPANGEK